MSTSQFYYFRCKWDPSNYSCSYDCIFMTFAWMYFHATEHWRMMWMGQSRAARTLSHHLRIILHITEGWPNNPPKSQLSTFFPAVATLSGTFFQTRIHKHSNIMAQLTLALPKSSICSREVKLHPNIILLSYPVVARGVTSSS